MAFKYLITFIDFFFTRVKKNIVVTYLFVYLFIYLFVYWFVYLLPFFLLFITKITKP